MHQFLSLRRLCTSYLFSAALLYAVLALIALLPSVAVAADKCPCATSGSATKLHKDFLRQEFDFSPTTDYCSDELSDTTVIRLDGPEFNDPFFLVGVGNSVGDDEFLCNYYLTDGEGQIIFDVIGRDLQPGEVEACRKDIRKLIAKLDDCPNPIGSNA